MSWAGELRGRPSWAWVRSRGRWEVTHVMLSGGPVNIRGMCVTDKEEEQGRRRQLVETKALNWHAVSRCHEREAAQMSGFQSCSHQVQWCWVSCCVTSGILCLSHTEVNLHLVPANRQGYLERVPCDWEVRVVGRGPDCDILTGNRTRNAF